MIQHLDRNRRVEQRTYDPDLMAHQIEAEIIRLVGERRYLAYRMLRLQNRSQRYVARELNCHRRSVARWAEQVESVIQELSRKHRAA